MTIFISSFHTSSSKFGFSSNPQRYTGVCFSGEEDESHLVAVEVMGEQEVRLKKVMVIQNIISCGKVRIIGTPTDAAETRINCTSFFSGHWLCCCCINFCDMIFLRTCVVSYSANPVKSQQLVVCSSSFMSPFAFSFHWDFETKVVSHQQVSKASPVVVDQPAQFKVPVVQEQAQWGVQALYLLHPLQQVLLDPAALRTVQISTVKEETSLNSTTR